MFKKETEMNGLLKDWMRKADSVQKVLYDTDKYKQLKESLKELFSMMVNKTCDLN